MPSYYNACMQIGGQMTWENIMDLVRAIDRDAPEGSDYDGLDAASYVGQTIEIPWQPRPWGDFRHTREFCNANGLQYDIDTENELGYVYRFSFRPALNTHLEDDWPENPIPLVDDEPVLPVEAIREVLDNNDGTWVHFFDELTGLCERSTPPELEPISLVASEPATT